MMVGTRERREVLIQRFRGKCTPGQVHPAKAPQRQDQIHTNTQKAQGKAQVMTCREQSSHTVAAKNQNSLRCLATAGESELRTES